MDRVHHQVTDTTCSLTNERRQRMDAKSGSTARRRFAEIAGRVYANFVFCIITEKEGTACKILVPDVAACCVEITLIQHISSKNVCLIYSSKAVN